MELTRRQDPVKANEIEAWAAQLERTSQVLSRCGVFSRVCPLNPPPLRKEGRSIFNELLFRRGFPIFYAFDLLYLNGRDLRQLPLIERKEKLRNVIDKSGLPDVICGKYVEGRGVDLFNEVVRRNLEGVVAKRTTGTYAKVSGWLKIKNPLYTQSERRHELFETFKAKETKQPQLPPIPKKPPQRSLPNRAYRKLVPP